MGFVSGPTPPYSNPPIEPQFYKPSRFVIDDITLGQTTLVQTTEDLNYVVGQQVRLLIPERNGAIQLNGAQGYVLSVPAPNQVILSIDSSGYDPFIDTTLVQESIVFIIRFNPTFIGCSNNFSVGDLVLIENCTGLTELNGNIYSVIFQNASSIRIGVDSSSFPPYTGGGTVTLIEKGRQEPQIIAIGDINSGIISSTGNVGVSTYIPGSFINISPQ